MNSANFNSIEMINQLVLKFESLIRIQKNTKSYLTLRTEMASGKIWGNNSNFTEENIIASHLDFELPEKISNFFKFVNNSKTIVDFKDLGTLLKEMNEKRNEILETLNNYRNNNESIIESFNEIIKTTSIIEENYQSLIQKNDKP